VKRNVYKVRRDAGDFPYSSALWSAGGESFQTRVHDPPEQRPGTGTEQYGAKVQEDHSDQQVAADERSEQIAVWT